MANGWSSPGEVVLPASCSGMEWGVLSRRCNDAEHPRYDVKMDYDYLMHTVLEYRLYKPQALVDNK